jgi:ABC-type nitrate/sulfonate/bicarbonate transport system substrate-binding protein
MKAHSVLVWTGLVLAALVTVAPVEAARSARTVVAFGGVRQVPYAATLIALDRLRDRGYHPVPVFMPRTELTVQAVMSGEADFALPDPISAATAIMRGAKIVIVGANASAGLGQWALVTPRTITAPAQLSRRRIAVHSLSSVSNTVVQFAIKHHRINGAHVLVIPGSPARAQALLRGEVDATSLFVTDAVRLDLTAPGRFHILMDFKELPLPDSVIIVRREWLATHQGDVEDLLRGLIETHRRIAAGPEWAVARTQQLFPEEDPAFVAAAVRAFVSRGIWDVNGGMTGPAIVQAMLRFLKETEALPAGASDQPGDYADLAPIEAVLKRVGRK